MLKKLVLLLLIIGISNAEANTNNSVESGTRTVPRSFSGGSGSVDKIELRTADKIIPLADAESARASLKLKTSAESKAVYVPRSRSGGSGAADMIELKKQD